MKTAGRRVYWVLGATHGRAPVGFAGIAIGLALTYHWLSEEEPSIRVPVEGEPPRR